MLDGAAVPTPLAFCPQCGERAFVGASLCSECGAAVGAQPVSSVPAPAAQLAPAVPLAPAPADPADPAEQFGWAVVVPTRPATPPASSQAPGLVGATATGRHAAPTASAVLGSVVSDFGALPLQTVIPLRSWFVSKDWRQGWIALFLAAALAPFILIRTVQPTDSLHDASIGFAIYFAFLWAVAIHAVVKPQTLPIGLLVRVGLFTAVAGVALAIALEKHLHADTTNVFLSFFTVGLPEEIAKVAPVFLFMFLGRTPWSVRTYLFVGAFSGLVFGAAEAISYSRLYGEVLTLTGGAPIAVVVELWRLLTDGLFHACMAGITAFFVGLAWHFRSMRVGLIAIGVAFAAALHGIYDHTADGWGGTLVACFIVFAFLGYVRTADQITEQLQARSVNGSGSPT